MDCRPRIVSCLTEIGQAEWDGLLALQPDANPFLSYAFLHALHASGSACNETGWQPQYLTLWQGERLQAALPLYLKSHSYGEYVFDWAWAEAYERHGLPYYPKLLSAIPFTPAAGPRLLARDSQSRAELVATLCNLQQGNELSSCHILYPPQEEAEALQRVGYMLRSGVQFHWQNRGFRDFADFADSLEQKKRKNILAERRKVAQAGVTLRQVGGADITEDDWRFFLRCYHHTYAAHRSTPYLNLEFFLRIGQTMPGNLLLVLALRGGQPIAASLLVHSAQALYGRYWGALEHVPCLHFETAYYQPLEFCIQQKIARFEGGAQGEHKLARGFLPQKTWSAHWLAQPEFADAVQRFLARESGGIESYIGELNEHNPFRPSCAR